jgi:hypothetical protein
MAKKKHPLFGNFGSGQEASAARQAAAAGPTRQARKIFKGIGSLIHRGGLAWWGSTLKALGPAAPIVDLLLRAGGHFPGAKPDSVPDAAALEEALDAAEAFLRKHRPHLFGESPGEGVRMQPDDRPLFEFQDAEDNTRRQVGGRTIYVSPDDPLATGEMIPVESSNVHSIGYDWNEANPMKGTLKVRFLQGDRKRGGKAKVAGPEYRYENVHPYVFEAMRRASSKGKFVWDRLRIRGSVSGHQFRYKLTGVAQGYVPRQATLRRESGELNQYFEKRRVTANTPSGKRVITSQLETRKMGRYQPDLRKVMSRGAPNRGEPFRG